MRSPMELNVQLRLMLFKPPDLKASLQEGGISSRFATIAAAGVVLGYIGMLALLRDYPSISLIFSDVAAALIDFLAAGCLFYAALCSRGLSRNIRLAWMMLAIAQLSYAFGDFLWTYFEIVLHQSAFPTIADIFYLMYYPLFFIGILLLPAATRSASDQLKMLLDTGIVMITAVLIFWQLLIALGVGVILFLRADSPQSTALLIPYFKDVAIPLGWIFVPFVCVVIVGTSNAVNLTDGLDGLAIMPTVLVGGALGIFAWVAGNAIFARYLGVPYVAGAGELLVFCAAIAGAGLGFLWFNTYPAQVFMGDIGALSLGGALGVVAVVVRQEVVLLIMGGIFVAETVSVIMQVASFKMTGKRIFRMAPLHHHFELKGWPEPRVIVRFWIITVILVLVGLSSLKIR